MTLNSSGFHDESDESAPTRQVSQVEFLRAARRLYVCMRDAAGYLVPLARCNPSAMVNKMTSLTSPSHLTARLALRKVFLVKPPFGRTGNAP